MLVQNFPMLVENRPYKKCTNLKLCAFIIKESLNVFLVLIVKRRKFRSIRSFNKVNLRKAAVKTEIPSFFL